MSIEFDSNQHNLNNTNLPDNDNIQEDYNERNFEVLLETINKHIDFLKNKFNVFDFQEKSIQNVQETYYKDLEKIENNKELFRIKIDEM